MQAKRKAVVGANPFGGVDHSGLQDCENLFSLQVKRSIRFTPQLEPARIAQPRIHLLRIHTKRNGGKNSAE